MLQSKLNTILHQPYFYYGILLLFSCTYIALQLPFLQADPDYYSINYAGPYTDEGLNSIQIRNFVNHNNFTMDASDNLVKTPLFAGVLYIPFVLLGTKLWVGRITILLGSLLLFFISFYSSKQKHGVFILGLFTIALTEFHTFHFIHFCLAEALSTLFIFASIMVLNDAINSKVYHKKLFFAALLMSCSYYLKIQFLYVLPILPVALVVRLLFTKDDKTKYLRIALWVTGWLVFFLLAFILFWYLPNKELFEYVMQDQTDGRFADLAAVPHHVAGVVYYMLLTPHLIVFTSLFCALWVIGCINVWKNPTSKYSFLFMVVTAWLLLESHKLLMTYHPTRYFVSFIFAMGVLSALVLAQMWQQSPNKGIGTNHRTIVGLIILLFALQNSVHYIQSIHRRTYEIKHANEYLAKYPIQNQVVLGARAPSVCWNCKSISMPVWAGYFNYEKILEKKPIIIVEDPKEIASNQAFKKQGINLIEIADSVKHFGIDKWEINIYWINKKYWK